jgi:outer membrane autotransporter protein
MNSFGSKKLGSKRIVWRVAAALMVSTAPFAVIGQASAQAVGTCTPPTSTATPVNNAPVTCTGGSITANGTAGYGTGVEHDNQITVDSTATVTGTAQGFLLADNNAINNNGTVEATGPNGVAINTGVPGQGPNDISVTNSKTIQATATGGIAIQGGSRVVLSNAATGTVSGDTNAVKGSSVNINLNGGNAGTIEATGAGGVAVGSILGTIVVNAGTIQATGTGGIAIQTTNGGANITNSKTIEATKVGGIAIQALNGTATIESNTATGTITGSTNAIKATTVIVNGNDGTIEATGASGVGGVAIDATGNATITNSKTIRALSSFGIAIQAGGTATVDNKATGVITGGASGISAATLDVTNAGTISGGAVGITGAGSITNSGTISGGTGAGKGAVIFTGGAGVTNTLTMNGGLLVGDAVGSTAGATNKLVLQGTGAAPDNFLNFNSLDVQAGGGGWVLNGNATVGTATLENSLMVGSGTTPTLTGDVTVNSGGRLAGTGQVVGNIDVMSGGTLAPGRGGPTTFKASGSVTFENTSTFVTSVFSSGNGSALSADSVTIKGGKVDVRADNGAGNNNYAPSTRYTIITATGPGGVTGTFDSVTTNLVFLKPTLTYDSKDVFLTLDLINGGGTAAGFGFAPVAQTRNQAAVAGALDASPISNPLVGRLLSLTIDGARAAFDALSGEIFGSVHNTQGAEASFTRSGILGRLRQASYADVPGELGALGFAGPELAYADGRAPSTPADGKVAYGTSGRLAYAANGNDSMAADMRTKAPRGINNVSRDLTFWAQGLGGWGHADSDGNAASLKSRFAGFLSGADMRFGDVWRAGLVAGYTRSYLNVNARASSAGIDSVTFGLYAGGKFGAFNLRTGGSFSYDSIDVSRSVFFPGFTDATKAHFHGQVGQVFGELGYGIGLGTFAIEPFAGLAYVHLQDGSFLESGGLAALSGSSAHESIGYSSLGIRAATFMPLGNGTVLVPRASAQWQHAFGDVTPTTALAFQSTGTAFTVAGLPIARNSALIEAGLDWRFTPQAKLGAFYQGELAAHAQSHAIKGGFTWDF